MPKSIIEPIDFFVLYALSVISPSSLSITETCEMINYRFALDVQNGRVRRSLSALEQCGYIVNVSVTNTLKYEISPKGEAMLLTFYKTLNLSD